MARSLSSRWSRTRSRHAAVGAVTLSLTLATAPGCYRAPTLDGADQVYNPNVEATAQKDNGLAARTWDPIDIYMLNTVVGGASRPGCALGISRGDELIYLKGYGKAELDGEDWGVATMGAVGSVSKTFTAAGLLLMHQLDMVDVNQPVDHYLATGNAALGNRMIARLLNHQSGVGGGSKDLAFGPNWEATSDAQACLEGAPVDCDEIARDLAQPRLAFAQYEDDENVAALADADPNTPGSLPQGVYSNVGYSVAAAIVDERAVANGYDGYEEWIWDRVGNAAASGLDADNLWSLALTHSWRAADIPHRAVGYRRVGNAFVEYEAFDPDTLEQVEGWEGPSGGWAMTIGDLTRFALLLNRERIVDDAMLAAMRHRWADLDQISDDAGMGMLLNTGAGAPYWHGGIIGGHTAAWTWWDEYQGATLGISIMCNRQDLPPFTLKEHTRIIAGLTNGTAPVLPPVTTPPSFQVGGAAGRAWVLDRARAWQATPRGAILPITGLLHDLVVKASVQGGQLRLQLVHATVTGNQAVPVTGRTPTALGTVTYTNPRFTTAPATVNVASSVGDIQVRGLVVSGAIDRQGTALSGVTLRGSLDARQIGPRVGRSATALCSELATTGTTCAPCADGVATCLGFVYQGFAGRGVSMP